MAIEKRREKGGKAEKSKKPAKFTNSRGEFSELLREVKNIGRAELKGLGKRQLEAEFRARLGVKPKTLKTPYNLLQAQRQKEKRTREENRKLVGIAAG